MFYLVIILSKINFKIILTNKRTKLICFFYEQNEVIIFAYKWTIIIEIDETHIV